MAKRHVMTPKRKTALHKAQLASARRRKSHTRRNIAIGVSVLAVTGAGIYSYNKSPALRRHVRRVGSTAKRNVKPVSSFVGGMVRTPAGAVAHLQALKGAVMGKKASRTFLESSYNWEKMHRQNPGSRLYTVG